MPIVRVTLIEGYGEAVRGDLADALTRAVRGAIDAPPDGITVVLDEVPAANYRRGGRPRVPGPPRPRPRELALAYLGAMERRDLEAAGELLAPGFAMTFPGGRRFERPEDLVAWARGRYRTARKTIERVEEVPGLDEVAVWCSGTLFGEWADGTPFEGVRFVDRLSVRDGRLASQEVWNDLAEARGGPPGVELGGGQG